MPKQIKLATELGSMIMELDLDKAPITANHFLSLVTDGSLKDSFFYRIVHDSGTDEPPTIDVIQGGLGWESTREIPATEHETTLSTGLSHCDGAVSLARSSDTGAGSEFFICIGDQPILDATEENSGANGGFAVFGRIIDGMDVVLSIHNLPADRDPPGGDERFAGQFLTDYVAIDIQLLPDEPSS